MGRLACSGGSSGTRRVHGFVLALGLAVTLAGCSSASPTANPTAAPTAGSPTASGSTAVAGPDPTSPGPVPTATADPLTPTRPTPTASSTPSVTSTTATAPTPTATSTTDAGSVAGACERTLTAYPVLQPGATGPAVRALQCFLDDADYGPVAVDGVYGPQTRAAMKRVEATYEGPAPKPGRVDAGVWVLLISRSLGSETLATGAKGPSVATLQRALRAAGGTIAVDGVFGAETKRVVQRFQQANRVGDDGVVGDETLFLLKMGATIG